MMNSEFVQDRAEELAELVKDEADAPAKIRAMYRQALAREPDEDEIRLAMEYLESSSHAQYAQALLSTNEVIFWP
jgi:hypothetical protein